MEICPQYAAIDVFAGLQHVMVIAPIDSDKDESENITEKSRNNRPEGGQACAERNSQLKHKDGYDHSDHAIAECFHAGFGHFGRRMLSRSRCNPAITQRPRSKQI